MSIILHFYRIQTRMHTLWTPLPGIPWKSDFPGHSATLNLEAAKYLSRMVFLPSHLVVVNVAQL
jgi:hypothetical protein